MKAAPGASAQTPPPRRLPWLRIVGAAGGIFLGAVLLVATWAKVINPGLFAESIEQEGLDFVLPAPWIALFALLVEGSLGFALILDLRRRYVLIPAALLVAFFLFLTGRSYLEYLQGVEQAKTSCGCFGSLVLRTPAQAFWQDFGLLLPPLILAFLGRPPRSDRKPWFRLGIVAAGTLATFALFYLSPDLQLDELATRLKPDARVDDLCVGQDQDRVCIATLLPEIEQGDHLVILADLQSPVFTDAVQGLNDMLLSGRGPGVWALSSAVQEDIDTFFWTHAPSFQIRQAPLALLRPLYRRLPRSFLVHDGVVTETFSGIPAPERLLPASQDG